MPLSRRVMLVSLICGLVAGVVLVGLIRQNVRGWVVVIAYAALVLAILLYLRRLPSLEFRARFSATLVAFMTASVIAYFYVVVFSSPTALSKPLWDNAWPLGVFAAIGCVLSSLVAVASRVALKQT